MLNKISKPRSFTYIKLYCEYVNEYELIEYVPKSIPSYVVNRNVKLKDRGRLTRFTSISNIAYNETKAACQVKKEELVSFIFSFRV